MDILNELNAEQRRAASHKDGPLLIVAGAGAGKTRTLAYRILNLIQGRVPPEKILAITFTNKAAGEMRGRVKDLLAKSGQKISGAPFVSTFHALCAHILRQHASAAGLSRYFSIYDKNKSKMRVKQAMRQANLDEKRFEPSKILAAISRAKGEGKTAQTYDKETRNFWERTVAQVWSHYDTILAKERALDFDDLLLKAVQLLKNDKSIRHDYQGHWQYLHIDEYQDTNSIQYELAKLLSEQHKNICVVGDADQSIYSWRGADFTNILNFERDYPGASVVLLEENYRSTQNILEAANRVIKKNTKRKEKNLFTQNGAGEPIGIHAALDENAEARFVATKAKQLIGRGARPDEIAVLYRANFQSRALEEALLETGVSYQVLGTRFYERREVRDALAYLKLALNPADMEALKRAVNVPPRGIGPVTLEKILTGQTDKLPAKIKEKVDDFNHKLAAIHDFISQHRPAETVKFVIWKSDLETSLSRDKEEGEERLENLRELVSLATKYDGEPGEEGILALLTETSLVTDQDALLTDGGGVRLSTVHAAKGLEWDHVFITGLEQGLFPHQGLNFEADHDEEEERRLFYVALTRARKKVWLTYTQARLIFGSRRINLPSEFIFDIDDSLLEAENGEEIYVF